MNDGSLHLNDIIAGLGTASLVMLASDSTLGRTFALSLGTDFFAADQRQGVSILSLHKSPKGETGEVASWPTSAASAPVVVCEDRLPSVEEIQARARQMKARQGTLRLLIIHGLEPLWNTGDRDEQEASRLIEELRALSDELDLTILTVVPFSARSARRTAVVPSPTTIRAFQSADLALLFEGEEVYDWHATGRHMAEITLVKPTVGDRRTCRLRISDDFRFDELPAAS